MISKLATLKPFTKSSSFSSLLSSSAFARSDLQPTQHVELDRVTCWHAVNLTLNWQRTSMGRIDQDKRLHVFHSPWLKTFAGYDRAIHMTNVLLDASLLLSTCQNACQMLADTSQGRWKVTNNHQNRPGEAHNHNLAAHLSRRRSMAALS